LALTVIAIGQKYNIDTQLLLIKSKFQENLE